MAHALNIILRITVGTMLMLALLSSASAQETCPMTLDALPMCITHQWENGYISNHGVYNSLLAKADAAIEAQNRGHNNAAINILNAFIHEVNAQSSKKITNEAADHMIMHAQAAITNLQPASP